MNQRPIVVFDSGLGGFSLYRPLRVALPHENIIYIADSAHFPYGDKSLAWLQKRFTELALDFNHLNPKLLVLACNTATTSIIADLRQALHCPVVGVEPVIKPLCRYKKALVLMTQGSANSQTTAALLRKFGTHVQIHVPHGLASAIEYNNYEQVKKNIHEIKQIVQEQNIEAIGLSCTHYPLILKEFQAELPGVTFIDPSIAVVEEVIRVLKSITRYE